MGGPVVRDAGTEALPKGFPLAKDRPHGGIRLLLAAVDQDFKRSLQENDASI